MSQKYGYNHGDFSWNELAPNDPQAALSFYREVFGWKVETLDMPEGPYNVLINGEEKIGGIMAKPAEQSKAPTAWMPYITVDNVDETVAKIESLGGKVIVPPSDIPVPDGPRLSIFQDPQGATLGAITYANAPAGT